MTEPKASHFLVEKIRLQVSRGTEEWGLLSLKNGIAVK